ncbi:MAG TPA: glutathione S-transferase N-terminal domain-containing protein, partial [Allosphingosinicella sp.]
MWQLYQFPLCPFSRKVRLMLAEKAIAHELVRESPWLKRDEFTDLNPAGQTPVLVEEARGIVLIDSKAICEYFEETVDKAAMINGTAANRAEIRRLVTWFDTQFYRDVTGLLLHERVVKRIAQRSAPDAR